MRRNILVPMAVAYILFTAVLLMGSEEKTKRIIIGDTGDGTIEIGENGTEESTEASEAVASVEESTEEDMGNEVSENIVADADKEVTVSDDTVSSNTGEKIFYDVPLYNDNTKNVMIRTKPYIGAKIIGKIRPGDTAIAMHVEKDEREWTIVSYNGIIGYSNLPVMYVQWDKAVLSQYTDEDLTEKAE
ncbi:MAG: hypothetical protein K6G84_07095 [Lachnospiraceae bacterium]|nr:hypothetical protein [Lachnospiraceae bacterium]